MSAATEPAAGFTAVNGRSPPSWTERPQPSANHIDTMDSNLFAHSKLDPPPRTQGDNDESRKRKRVDSDSSSPNSTSSQRPRLSPTTSHSHTHSGTLPPITNGHSSDVPYTTQEPNAQMPKPTYIHPNEGHHWHPQRSSIDDTTTENRLMEAFNRDGHPAQPNGNGQPPHYAQTSGSDDEQGSMEQQQNGSLQSVPGMTAANLQKQRKRNFANRTKTGCLTCRERKKKCDEAKPTCNNCIRGGFSCKGYSQTQQLRGATMQPPLVQKPDGPFAIPGSAAAYTTAPFPPNAIYYHTPQEAIDHSRAQFPPREDPTRGFIDPSVQPPYSRPFAEAQASPFIPDPMRAEYAHMGGMADFGRQNKHLPPPGSLPMSTSMGRSGPYAGGSPFSDPKNMAHQALLVSNGRTEKEKMINHAPFNPNDPTLTADRRECAKFVYRFNAGCENPENLSPTERRLRLRAIVEGREPTDSPRSSDFPKIGSGHIGREAQVQPPFYCDYGYNVSIGDGTEIGRNCTMLDACTVKIGKNCVIGPDVKFLTQDVDKSKRPENPMMPEPKKRLMVAHPITVDDEVVIGAGCTIYPGIHIARGAIIAPGVVVDDYVKAEHIVGPNHPMRVLTGGWGHGPQPIR